MSVVMGVAIGALINMIFLWLLDIKSVRIC
jgi:hypothetical protein